MKYFILSFFLFCFSEAVAQKISGIVKDEEGHGIEYVNIGIINGTVGTISGEKGEFKITLPDSLNHRVIRFSRLGFKLYDVTVKELKNGSGVVKLDRDILKINDIQVQAFGSKKASFKEVIINQRGMRIPGGAIVLQEFPKITENWVSDPKVGYQYGVIVESDKTYMPRKMEVPILDCLTDTVLFRVNIYDIDKHGSVSKMLNTEEIFFTVKKKLAQKVYDVDLSSQALTLKGKQYFALEVIAYSYLLGKDEMIVKFPLFSGSSYFRKSSQGMFEKFPNNVGVKIWALVEK